MGKTMNLFPESFVADILIIYNLWRNIFSQLLESRSDTDDKMTKDTTSDSGHTPQDRIFWGPQFFWEAMVKVLASQVTRAGHLWQYNFF